MENMLEVININKKIGKNIILKDINFSIRRNSIFGLVGPNGAGKTTLLKIILGLSKSDSGLIKINGYDLNKEKEKALKKVGNIIENPNMYENFTGLENLEIFKSMFRGISEDKIKKIVRLVSLEKYIGKKVKTFSLGMKQRLGLAQALLNNPNLLILDEPTNGLDVYGIIELREFLKNLNDVTVIISSHILSEIESICDEVLFLNKGKIIEIKKLNKINNKKTIKFSVSDEEKAKIILKNYCFMDELVFNIKDEEASKINKILVKNDIKVFRIEEQIRTLEEEFIDKMKEGN